MEMTAKFELEQLNSTFNASFTQTCDGETEEYKGSYEVIPKFEEQIIPTASKVMRNDMKIKEIPVVTVSNSSGGNTKIIG